MPETAAIIGCGAIAGGYDQNRRGDGLFSHAGVYADAGIRLAAVYDPDPERAAAFAGHWGAERVAADLPALLAGRYDLISVCTPDDSHAGILAQVIAAGGCRAIWTEKPLTLDAASAGAVIEAAEAAGIGLWLGNQRRWEPGHERLRERIAAGEFGALIHATGHYVKGITHIGCTLINTLRFLFGEVAWAQALPPWQRGSWPGDPSLNGVFGFAGGGVASVIGCDEDAYRYSIFEIDAVFSAGRVRIENNGDTIRIFTPREYRHYPGFFELAETATEATEMKWAMRTGLARLRRQLEEDGKGSCASAREGLADLKVIDALKRSAAAEGARLAP